ncbi:MAG: alpha/beta hydrolase family protein [Beijerinckiaceae bacterium]|nr:alpha/beta hydrolase family protein [Beijerinckiaceae bacterium]
MNKTDSTRPTRRSAILSAAALGAPIALMSAVNQPAEAQTRTEPTEPAKTFVLVHGAYGGGYVWKYVAARLRAKGHRVFTPTLTGLADRSHLMSKDIRLATHITDVVNVIKWEDLRNVTLVGHSYGGWPVSGVPEQVEDAIGSIVFLDAFLPSDGQKGLDLNSPKSRAAVLEAISRGDVSRPPTPSTSKGMSAADRDWLLAKATPQPIGVSLDPIKLTGARERVARKSYIRARNFPNPNFDSFYDTAKTAGWDVFDLPSGHNVQVEMPDQLTDILLKQSA